MSIRKAARRLKSGKSVCAISRYRRVDRLERNEVKFVYRVINATTDLRQARIRTSAELRAREGRLKLLIGNAFQVLPDVKIFNRPVRATSSIVNANRYSCKNTGTAQVLGHAIVSATLGTMQISRKRKKVRTDSVGGQRERERERKRTLRKNRIEAVKSFCR